MSHFAIIVVGQDIDAQLAPYAEQEADEQYLKFNNLDDEGRDEYENKEYDVAQLADGSVHSIYDSMFSKGSERIYPNGSILRKGKMTEIYPTFEEFMEGWHGYSRNEETGAYGYWHNPNAKWDWYSIGGRWTGYFKPKAGCDGEVGESGAFGNKPKQGWVDVIKAGNIDVKAMQQAAVDKANKTYDDLENILQGRQLPSWNDVRERHGNDIEAARQEYNGLQVVKDLNKGNFWAMGDLVEAFGNSREEYVEKCKNQTMVPYAVVKDGKWYQKGEMGWFGMSSDEMSQDEWNKQFWEMFNSLPSDTMLTAVDCHI